MKRVMILLTAVLVIAAQTVTAQDRNGTPENPWNCGADDNPGGAESVTAVMIDGTLTIRGVGRMKDFSSTFYPNHPWSSVRDSITKVIIEDGVTYIGERALQNIFYLTSVTIPNSMIHIGENAFWNCRSLTSVIIPTSVTTIGNSAFKDCWDLTSVTIGNSVTTIGDNVFASCSSLTSVTIPNSVTTIGNGAFNGCTGLTSVTISNSVTIIGDNVFANCSSLTSVTIPNSVTYIKETAFQNCSALASIEAAQDNNNYSSEDGVLFNKDKTYLLICPAGKQGAYTILESVTSIAYSAFYRCTGLTSVTIPSSVTSIRDGAFYYCTGLTSVTIPNSVVLIGNQAFAGCTGLTSVTIPNSVTYIGESAFSQCTGLTSLTIGNSVTYISGAAFNNCTGLDTIILLGDVPPVIGIVFGTSNAFDIVVKTATDVCLYVPQNSLTAYDQWDGFACVNSNAGLIAAVTFDTQDGAAASSQTAVKERLLPKPVNPTRADYTFGGWYRDAAGTQVWNFDTDAVTEDITLYAKWDLITWDCGKIAGTVFAQLLEGTLTVSGTGAMADYSSDSNAPWYNSRGRITNAVIEDGVTSVGDWAFYNCAGLNSVNIPNSVTSVGSYAFYNSLGLTSITVPKSVTSIAAGAFYYCAGLTSIAVEPDNSDYSSEDGILFNKNKTALLLYPSGIQDASYTIPDSVTSIGEMAFNNCTALTSVTIPGGVTEIGDNAFGGCGGLTSVISLNATPPQIASGTFSGINKAEVCLYVPKNSAGVYGKAAYWEDFDCIEFSSLKDYPAVTFDSRDGSAVSPQTVLTGSKAAKPANPALTDHTFAGWYKDGGLTAAWNFDDDVVTEDITLYAKWRALWDCGVIPETVFAEFIGGTLTVSGEGAMKDYSDDAPWNNSKSSITKVVIEDGVTSIGEWAFYGGGSLNSVTIGNSVASIGEWAFYGCGSLNSVTIGNSVASIGSYAFDGCTGLTQIISLNAVPPEIGSSTFYGVDKANVCLYVPQSGAAAYGKDDYWKEFDCLQTIGGGDGYIFVTFDLQDGRAANSQAVLTGGKAAEPANPVRVGYTFIGWYKDEEFDEAWDFEEDTVTEDITLYAKWEIITYTVTWNTDGGTPDPAQTTVEHDGSITDPGAALRSGYAFAGWYSDEDFLSEAVFPVPYVTEDMEFYAKWLRIYTVDWNADGGTPAPSQMFLKHGDKIYEPDAMEKTGHVFLGWYKDSDFAEAWDFNSGAVEGPVNLYALWIDGVSVLSPDRVIPNKPDVQNPGVPSANVMSGEFTAGPNPVVKSAGKVDLFWQGSGIKSSTLYIYDASGNLVKKVNVTDKSIGKSDRRVVGTWDLKNSKGYAVSAGTYVVKGKIATRDGKSERVSLILSIR